MKLFVVFALLCTGCASDAGREIEQTYQRFKSTPGEVYCYDMLKPASIKGKYCSVYVPIEKENLIHNLGPL